jgi:integrase
VSLDRCTVTFWPNAWRRLKTPSSHRVVRLSPQLAEILGTYLHWRMLHRGGRLLFPSRWSPEERILGDLRNCLTRWAGRSGLPPARSERMPFGTPTALLGYRRLTKAPRLLLKT